MSKTTEQKLLKHIDQHKLIENGDNILISLSGGADSVFLFYFLLKFKRRLGINLAVFHLNHNLRGSESKKDEQFCRAITKKNNVECFIAQKNVKAYAKKNKISVEEAGRILRYKELEKITKKFSYQKIATAHNANDNAETILLNLIKGTGLQGISGIPVKRGKVIRPILPLTKDEILNYLKMKKIDFRVDSSNLSNEYERNFLRNEILPQIKSRLNPKVESSLYNFSENIKSVNDFINSIVMESIKSSVKNKKDSTLINLKKVKNLNKNLHALFFKFVLYKFYYLELSSKNLNALVKLLTQQAGKKVNLGDELIAIREREFILVTKNLKDENLSPGLTIKAGETKKINGRKLRIKLIQKSKLDSKGEKDIEYISASDIHKVFEVRRWKEGDRFIPIGMKGSKKISDFLNEQKIPSLLKKEQLVLTNSGKIVWVIGLRIDERFKLKKNFERAYQLCLI